MIADKAVSMEGRKLGYLKDDLISSGLKQFEDSRLADMVLQNQFRDPPPVDEAEVERMLKQDPKLTRERATMIVRQVAGRRLVEQFCRQLAQKFELKKVEDNFMQAALIHQRLLHKPGVPRGPNEYWILNRQVREELSEKEKNLVLATYKGGQFTLKDWFQVVCNIAPPKRSSDLNTPGGVERLLDGSLGTPILVAEAKARGYDKDVQLRSDVRQAEDQRLFYKVEEEKTKGQSEPTAEQIKDYFEKNKEKFAQGASVKISQIWCPDLEAAKKLREILGGGADFETVRAGQSLQKDEGPHNVYPGSEGLFWAELWKAEPNQTLGPMKGFHGSGVKWRIVRILEKTPPNVLQYSEQVANSVKWAMMGKQRQQTLDDYRTELLKKYPYEIFGDRIKGLDPLEIALNRDDK
ncbi:MAG: hypothetical protein A2Y76_05165 [Planctomycetes bacterium RBG_13_60_9]|nr:MAG: hypothetical protein A2Y76_05165 [Planctomycetes bacterium RBG_13_60_9]